MADSEIFMTEMYDEGVVTEVIRPAAIVPEESARAVLVELALRDVQYGGLWLSDPSRWALYDAPWGAPGQPGRGAARRHDPGRLRHPDALRDHHLPRHDHPARHRARLDRHEAVRRGARLRQPRPRDLPARLARPRRPSPSTSEAGSRGAPRTSWRPRTPRPASRRMSTRATTTTTARCPTCVIIPSTLEPIAADRRSAATLDRAAHALGARLPPSHPSHRFGRHCRRP